MHETQHAYDQAIEQSFREVHEALDSLESFLKEQIGHDPAYHPNPVDALVQVRQALIAARSRREGHCP